MKVCKCDKCGYETELYSNYKFCPECGNKLEETDRSKKHTEQVTNIKSFYDKLNNLLKGKNLIRIVKKDYDQVDKQIEFVNNINSSPANYDYTYDDDDFEVIKAIEEHWDELKFDGLVREFQFSYQLLTYSLYAPLCHSAHPDYDTDKYKIFRASVSIVHKPEILNFMSDAELQSIKKQVNNNYKLKLAEYTSIGADFNYLSRTLARIEFHRDTRKEKKNEE